MATNIIGGLTASVDLVSVAELQQKVSSPGSVNGGDATAILRNDKGIAQGSVTRDVIEQALANGNGIGAQVDFRA